MNYRSMDSDRSALDVHTEKAASINPLSPLIYTPDRFISFYRGFRSRFDILTWRVERT